MQFLNPWGMIFEWLVEMSYFGIIHEGCFPSGNIILCIWLSYRFFLRLAMNRYHFDQSWHWSPCVSGISHFTLPHSFSDTVSPSCVRADGQVAGSTFGGTLSLQLTREAWFWVDCVSFVSCSFQLLRSMFKHREQELISSLNATRLYLSAPEYFPLDSTFNFEWIEAFLVMVVFKQLNHGAP